MLSQKKAVPQGQNQTPFPDSCRYSGWASLVVMVAFIVRLYNNGPAVWTTFLTTYWFWITVFTIVLVALPWAWVAKVSVDPKASPSGRVSLLRFPGNVTSGLYGRISRGSLTEWHVFGCFSESESAADSMPHHYMLCSAVGRFTKELVATPPTALYTRTIKFPGFSYCHRMYNGGVAICTGAAIGVCILLPLLLLALPHEKVLLGGCDPGGSSCRGVGGRSAPLTHHHLSSPHHA